MIRIEKRQEGFTLVELLMAMVFFSFILIFASASYIQINRSYVRGANVKLVQEQTRKVVSEITSAIRESRSSGVIVKGDDSFADCSPLDTNLNSMIGHPLIDPARSCRHRLCAGQRQFAWNQAVKIPDISEHSWYGFEGEWYKYRPGPGNSTPFSIVKTSSSSIGEEGCLNGVDFNKATDLIDSSRLMVQDIDIEEIVPDTWRVTVSLSTIDTTPGDNQDLKYEEVDGEYKALGCYVDSGSQQFCYVETLSTIVTVR